MQMRSFLNMKGKKKSKDFNFFHYLGKVLCIFLVFSPCFTLRVVVEIISSLAEITRNIKYLSTAPAAAAAACLLSAAAHCSNHLHILQALVTQTVPVTTVLFC